VAAAIAVSPAATSAKGVAAKSESIDF